VDKKLDGPGRGVDIFKQCFDPAGNRIQDIPARSLLTTPETISLLSPFPLKLYVCMHVCTYVCMYVGVLFKLQFIPHRKYTILH
jgi:hypothetical protein